ncbi:MAG: hypothetical protein EZS28_020332 [Streblomastix strix]|uniref:Uncharacterized protein n=1 Tax=Streblomastix strix TaxID=222440 RepID=A0A5J4VPF0_9EUKA|nr:MAG: hypothetical protein EZS28_020332 [Streblomastix strix]
MIQESAQQISITPIGNVFKSIAIRAQIFPEGQESIEDDKNKREQQIKKTLPLKVNVFPSADIYNPLFSTFQSAVLHIINEPSGLLIIVHYPAISPDVLVGEVPIQIAQRLLIDVFAILKPSSYDTVVGFI